MRGGDHCDEAAPEDGSVTPAFDETDAPERALIDKCVHCGFCLPACPTYVMWGDEMDSPRGRIYLMKGAIEGRAALTTSFVRHFDACLGCMACVTACPSGVQYGPLIEATRGQIERRYSRSLGDRWFRSGIFFVFPYPTRLRFALVPLALTQPILNLLRRPSILSRLPERLRALIEIAPPVSWRALFSASGGLPERTSAVGVRRSTIGILSGCVQRLVFPEVNQAAVRVLSGEGCDVLVPRDQGCCGALSLHAGRLEEARAFARRTIETFEGAGVDRVAVSAAGCGSSMKEYGQLLSDDAQWAERARAFSSRVRDLTELVGELGAPRMTRHPMPLRVAYQDACHLAHAQGIRQPPRDILSAIPGVELLPIAEADLCCGSAGIYNLVEPDTARQLGDRKIKHVDAVKPDVVATANPGCHLQMKAAGHRSGRSLRIVHPIELVDASIRGQTSVAGRGR
jgi:glycolate oxidase iron-sulfur subunit